MVTRFKVILDSTLRTICGDVSMRLSDDSTGSRMDKLKTALPALYDKNSKAVRKQALIRTSQ